MFSYLKFFYVFVSLLKVAEINIAVKIDGSNYQLCQQYYQRLLFQFNLRNIQKVIQNFIEK